jgi:hypothetical protein
VKLPVAPEQLRARFPSLTDDDLEAFKTVTERVLGDAPSRGRAIAEVMAAAQRAHEKDAAGLALADDELLALRYVRAVEKMQG